MAALAYLLLPVTGCIAYFSGSTPRVRFHGLQAVAYGAIWPVVLYIASMVSATATRVGGIVGAVFWLVLIVGTAVGRDPAIPGLRRILRSTAEDSPRAPTRDGD